MKAWFTPQELASLALPGLPVTKRSVTRIAAREGWNKMGDHTGQPLARKRSGRGGGFEYHFSVLPPRAIAALSKKGVIETKPKSKRKARRDADWMVYDSLPKNKKQTANFRLKVLTDIEALRKGGSTKTAAIETIRLSHQKLYLETGNPDHKFSRATVFIWYGFVKGRAKRDWLPALAPRHIGRLPEQDIAPEVIDLIRADYLRPEKPSFSSCYRRLLDIASQNTWEVPHKRTLQRRFLEGVPKAGITLMREGMDALEALYPPQIRDRSEFHALEAVNADGHRWDVFASENGSAPFRPCMVALQDLYSGKILSWRIGHSFGSELVRLAFGDMFRDYGIPDLCWLDNGRDFAAKLVTGGTATRYRFKVKEEDPTGFLTALGVQVHWCRPGRGQSKPIERAFRDMCDDIAKHPKFSGAYTGNSPHNKPSNYGQKAVDFDLFKAVVSAGIEAHNSRAERRTRVCQGRQSFDQAFEASYAQSPITRASEAQLRMCMLAGKVRKSDRKSGAITLYHNIYWHEKLAEIAGDRVVARFDPDDLHQDIHVYHLDGSYLCSATLLEAQGFSDLKAARDHSNAKKKWMKAQKDLATQLNRLDVTDVANALPDLDVDVTPAPSLKPKVVKPVFGVDGSAARKVDPFDFEQFDANISALEAEISDIDDYR